jgi:hypothetical protein
MKLNWNNIWIFMFYYIFNNYNGNKAHPLERMSQGKDLF